MSLRQWFVRLLGGSSKVERHGEVEIAVVEAWRAGLVGAENAPLEPRRR